MKPIVTLGLALVLVAATASITRAHIDGVGEPDPYWQQRAAASATRAAQAAAGDDAPADVSPFHVFVCASGIISLLFVVSVLRAVWAAAGRSSAAAETARPEAIRTVNVLPPSARGETRVVVRAAAAIIFGALCMVGLARIAAGDEVSDIPKPALLAVLVIVLLALRPARRAKETLAAE